MIDGLDEEPATVIAASTVTGHVDAPTNKETTPARRKKVRKGTRSCWECKRRKIRCIFASSENATCIGCQRRRAPCVSQDMPEDLSPARLGNRHLGERIAIVEDFMKNILASKDVASKCQFERDLRQDRYSNSDTLQTRSNDSAPSSVQAALTPSEVREPPIIRLDVVTNCRPRVLENLLQVHHSSYWTRKVHLAKPRPK